MLCNESFIGHFSLFYIQVMILFVIEEVRLRIDERFSTWHTSIEDAERARFYEALLNEPQLNSDIVELGFILEPKDIFPDNSLSMIIQVWNTGKHGDIGISWLVARGYTADKLDELKEDMPRILAYLRNVQTAKAIDAL